MLYTCSQSVIFIYLFFWRSAYFYVHSAIINDVWLIHEICRLSKVLINICILLVNVVGLYSVTIRKEVVCNFKAVLCNVLCIVYIVLFVWRFLHTFCRNIAVHYNDCTIFCLLPTDYVRAVVLRNVYIVLVIFYRALAWLAMQNPVLATVEFLVYSCLSVRLYITRWYCVKTTPARITKSSPTDSQRNLILAI